MAQPVYVVPRRVLFVVLEYAYRGLNSTSSLVVCIARNHGIINVFPCSAFFSPSVSFLLTKMLSHSRATSSSDVC